jgi:hypothetical protein
MVTRYLDIGSQFRDRNAYENPCDFVLEMGGQIKNNPVTALDPVIQAFPYETNLCSGGSTTTQIALSVTSSIILNYYRNSFIQIGNEFRLCTGYDNTTQIATVTPGFTVAPVALTLYSIRRALPVSLLGGQYRDVTGAPSFSTNEVVLGALAESIDDFYVNNWIFIPGPTPPGSYQWKRIIAYDGLTKVATLAGRFFSLVGAGETYEILRFSGDNTVPLRYYGTEVGTNNPVCAGVRMINLILPNRPVLSGYGGTLQNYPHLYVAIYSEKGITYSNPMISSSKGAAKALFKVPVTYYNDNTFLSLISADMGMQVSFKENDTLHFIVYLPDGEVLTFEPDPNAQERNDPEYGGLLFPIEPTPVSQVHAVFEVTRPN